MNVSATTATHRRITPRGKRTVLCAALIVAALASLYFFSGHSTPSASTSVQRPASSQSAPRKTTQVRADYGKLPLSFEANHGQADKAINFLARGAGYTLSLSPTQAVFALARPSDAQSQRRYDDR